MVTIQNVNYPLPCKVLSIGLDMQCHKVVSASEIIKVDKENDKFVILCDDGLKLVLPYKSLSGFYIDNKENRSMLEDYCKKEYNEWLSRCI